MELNVTVSTVLLLTGRHSNGLQEILVQKGLEPLVRDNIRACLDTLRHETVRAVVVDGTRTQEDLLEAVLNIRDVDASVPCIVLCPASSEHLLKLLSRVPRVHVILGSPAPEGEVVGAVLSRIRESR